MWTMLSLCINIISSAMIITINAFNIRMIRVINILSINSTILTILLLIFLGILLITVSKYRLTLKSIIVIINVVKY